MSRNYLTCFFLAVCSWSAVMILKETKGCTLTYTKHLNQFPNLSPKPETRNPKPKPKTKNPKPETLNPNVKLEKGNNSMGVDSRVLV